MHEFQKLYVSFSFSLRYLTLPFTALFALLQCLYFSRYISLFFIQFVSLPLPPVLTKFMFPHPIFSLHLSVQLTLTLSHFPQLSEVSEIPAENVEFAKGKGTFPCDMSVLDIASELDWSPRTGQLDQRPLYIMDDGAMIYYR